LPTSTTGQVIHHQFYSLSYNEEYEQAEWVAYELNKEHITSVDFKRTF
jgi:endonuclease G